jgi:hypothetical protein
MFVEIRPRYESFFLRINNPIEIIVGHRQVHDYPADENFAVEHHFYMIHSTSSDCTRFDSSQ